MTGRSPEKSSQHQQAGRIGAHRKWAMTEDRSAATQAARDAFNARFEDEVDPDGVLLPEERAKRAENARRAYYARLALKGAAARRARAAERRARTAAAVAAARKNAS